MVIDSSVLVAMLCDEPEAEIYETTIEADPVRLISAASFLEASLVIESRYGERGTLELDLLVHHTRAEIIPVDREQAEIGRQAYRRFGKGRHPAGLNFGDCFAYALTRVSGEPLLFQGGDFSRTDIVAVITSPAE